MCLDDIREASSGFGLLYNSSWGPIVVVQARSRAFLRIKNTNRSRYGLGPLERAGVRGETDSTAVHRRKGLASILAIWLSERTVVYAPVNVEVLEPGRLPRGVSLRRRNLLTARSTHYMGIRRTQLSSTFPGSLNMPLLSVESFTLPSFGLCVSVREHCLR